MESAAASGALVASMQESAREIADFDELVKLYWPRIFRFALASLRDHDAAQSVTQDCFLKAFRARRQFRGECTIKTWLMQIALNLVRDRARVRRLQFWTRAAARSIEADAKIPIPAGEIDAERRMLIEEKMGALWQAAARLPERQRTVFLLRYVEEMQVLEIAAVTGLKEGTVKIHLFRALRAVRSRLRRFQ